MRYPLRVNQQSIEYGGRTSIDPQDRDRQFEYIEKQRQRYAQAGDPTISIDTKKKELIVNFKNAGRSWEKNPIQVNDHDFPSDALGKAIQYRIYDTKKRGTIFLGTSHDTSAFAVDSVEAWWQSEGVKVYPYATRLLILADCCGSNSEAHVLEISTARQVMQSPWTDRPGLPLPAWGIEMEPDRTSVVF